VQCDTSTGFCTSGPAVNLAAGTACGSQSDTDCDNPNTCNGTGTCLARNEPNNTACTTDGIECTTDRCQNGLCTHPFTTAGVACGSPGDTNCDNPDTCDGAGACSVNNEPVTTECGPAAGQCDVAENCDGLGSCPATDVKSTAECRASGGECDPAEICDGATNDCPTDAKSSSECRASGGTCDPAETCDGVNNDCPTDAKSSSECRASGGACDPAESCDGATNDCPTDAKSSSECRASAGTCDPAEICDGVNNDCPATDVKSTDECRASAGDCDPAESCDGTSNECPEDILDDAQCNDDDVCTDDICDPTDPESNSSGCVSTYNSDNDPSCQGETEICRNALFWGGYAGTEKGGINIVKEGINYGGGCLEVCGEVLTETKLYSADSALEGLCVALLSSPKILLTRQLIAAALNCIMTNGNSDCSNTSIDNLFSNCNTICSGGNLGDIYHCLRSLECYNNGGEVLGDGFCQTGTCSDNYEPCNKLDRSRCGSFFRSKCEPTMGCDDEPLMNDTLNFDPPGHPGSFFGCIGASNSRCSVVGLSELACIFGNKSKFPEICF